MTDLRHQRLGITFFNRLEKLAREHGVEKVEAIFDDMLLTYGKVCAALTENTLEDRQDAIDEMVMVHKEVSTQYAAIAEDLNAVRVSTDLPLKLYTEESCELYRYALAAALEGQRLGQVDDVPENGIALLPGSLNEIYEEVQDHRRKFPRPTAKPVAANANKVTEPA